MHLSIMLSALRAIGALIVSCGSGKNMLSVSSLDGEWNITEVDGPEDIYRENAFHWF